MKTSESIKTIAPALLIAQKKMGAAVKGSVNPYYKSSYADLGAVMEACKEALNENGITVLQPVGSDDLGVYVETVLLHESSEYIADRMRISVKSQNDPQAQGSAITYARRYSLQSMVFIPAEDDDAERATDHKAFPDDKGEEVKTSIKCQECGEPAEVKKGEKNGRKWTGIFCTSGDKTHTKWDY